MWKVYYYILDVCEDGFVENVKQYSDVWYTEYKLPILFDKLQEITDKRKGKNKYRPVILKIESVGGHGDIC